MVVNLDNTFGRLFVLQEKETHFNHPLFVHAVTLAEVGLIQLLIWEMTTSVTLATMVLYHLVVHSTLVILSGMARGVVPSVPAASSTTLHGSARPSPSRLLMTWRLIRICKNGNNEDTPVQLVELYTQ